MKKLLKKTLFAVIQTFFFFLIAIEVSAQGSATTGFEVIGNTYIEQNIEVILYIDNIKDTTNDGGLAAFGGTIDYDEDKLELISSTSLGPFSVEIVGNKLGGFGQETIKKKTDIIKFVFKAKSLGQATISYSGSKQPDIDANPVLISGSSTSVKIENEPSSNAFLSKLSIEGVSFDFDKNKTTYDIKVDSKISNITIFGTAEDGNASIKGLGMKELNYGKNTFDILVTAPNGNIEKYTINIDREYLKSSNNNIKDIIIDGVTLTPNYDKNVMNYTLTIPDNIEKLEIDVILEDNKAFYEISGTEDLKTGSRVLITVTAEDGNIKIYSIDIIKNVDVILDNYLKNLKSSVGTLNPLFVPEITEYTLKVPHAVKEITFDYEPENPNNIVKLEGPDTLIEGASNIYEINVTDANGNRRVYTIDVYREPNLVEKLEVDTEVALFLTIGTLTLAGGFGSGYLIPFILNIFS